MISVYISVVREGDNAGHAEVNLPFVPAPGDTFYMDEGWGGMSVLSRSCTANDKRAEIRVDATSWSISSLKEVGFIISESYLAFEELRKGQ